MGKNRERKIAKRRKKRKPKTQLEPGDYLEAEQVRFILEILKRHAEDGRFRTAIRLFLFQLLLNTGLRRSEAAGLQLRDLPTHHGKSEVVVRWETAKGARNRGIVISDRCVALIKEYVSRFCKDRKPMGCLLLNEYGRPMTGQNIYARLKTIGKLTGIEALHPHMLRHTYLSLLYGISKDQMFVKDQGGHVKLDTTKIYVHIGDIERKKQVSKLDWLAT